jgi:PAS domain S-box-containing protein
VESRGSGVMITARVPLSAASETAGSAVSAPPAPALSTPVRPEAALAGSVSRTRGHVVIAEDHEETREYLCHVLEGAGFQVEGFSDGAAALATCVARPPDVVVSDVLMPGVGGFELIEHLRAGERTAVVPVLLLSARGGEESRIEGIAAGADDYLVKPLSGRELIARVDGAVRLGRLRREVARREQADLDALFSMAPDGLIVVGPTGAILAANEQAGRLFGYSTAEFAQLRIEALVPSASRAAHVTHRVAYGRAPIARMMHPMRELGGLRRDGTEFIVDIALGPLRFRNQPCTMAIIRDVSERRKLETERAGQEQRFRELSRRLVEVQEAERRQLSAELHDRTSPQLAAIQINLKMLGSLLRDRESEDVAALLDDTAHLIGETTIGIREISSNLRPAVLDDGGLLPALAGYTQQFTQRTGIQVAFDAEASGTAEVPAAVQSSLFRIVQEALTNCVKHAKARNVTIRLANDGAGRLSLLIADDGIGFDTASQSTTGLGLLTMRERAEFLGGRFVLESERARGTRILVTI